MEAPISKKTKLSFDSVKLYVCPTNITSKRLELMKNAALKNGFILLNEFGPEITHVITEIAYNEIFKKDPLFIQIKTINWKGHVCETKWLYECIKSQSIASEAAFQLQNLNENDEVALGPVLESNFDLQKFNECIPERKSIMESFNREITEGLELLAYYWELCHQSKTDERRALAFRRAASAVKCLPFRVTNSEQLKGIKGLGSGHALRIATQIFETEKSQEIEEKKNENKFISFKMFCQIFGVGPSIAHKWYALGLRTMEDVRARLNELDLPNNSMILTGIAFYDDLNDPVLLEEAQKIFEYITELAKENLSSVRTCMNGGFRRGKSSGHDVDILFSYPDERDFDGRRFISTIRTELDKRGLVIWSRMGNVDDNTDKPTDAEFSSVTSTSDHLPMCMIILKYPLNGVFGELANKVDPDEMNAEHFHLAASKRDWRAIRVDLIGSTTAQYPFAQVGWTGNKQYNRLLRQYAKDSLGYSLSSSGLYDMRQHRWISAETEKDVFQLLKLSYHEPWERNF